MIISGVDVQFNISSHVMRTFFFKSTDMLAAPATLKSYYIPNHSYDVYNEKNFG